MPQKLEWKLEQDHFLKGYMNELQLIPIYGVFFASIESGLVVKKKRISYQFLFKNSFQSSFQNSFQKVQMNHHPVVSNVNW